jgi:PAS domain S-box-containing protein
MNSAAQRMFGYSPTELIRRDVSIFLAQRPEDGKIQAYLKAVGNEENQSGQLRETEARRRDGSVFPVDVAVSPMLLADGMHYVAVIRDITERKRVEQMKAEFVSTVSHELRTPLTSIAGSLGLLAGGAGGELPERAARLIGIAHGNSNRLVRLINDILDIEKMESGQAKFNNVPLELGALVAQAVESTRGYADRFGVGMQIVPENVAAKVNSDSDRLIQVLTNLLSNAIKFSPRGEMVTVTISPGELRHRITISDRGLGIPEAFRERIFEKFAQADASDSRQKGGSGLGLAIVREIVSRLGGGVSFDSKAYQGTDFHVDLPAFHAPSHIDHARPLLLLGCGESTWAEEMRGALESAGYACVVAGDAKAVQTLAVAHRPVAILLDITLPEDGGIALIRALRNDPRLPMMPILAMSGQGGTIGEALAIVDWLGKPVAPPRLIEAVRQALKANEDRQPRVLHVDDDPDILAVVSSAFEGRAGITSVSSLESARAALAQNGFDLVILDLGLADGSGLELLPQLRHRDGTLVPVVVFSAQDADTELTGKVEAILTKSRTSLSKLVKTVEELAVLRGQSQ